MIILLFVLHKYWSMWAIDEIER